MTPSKADLQAIHARFQAAWDDHRDAYATFVREYPDEKYPRAPYLTDDLRMNTLIETRAKAKLVEEEYRAATENFLALERARSGAE
jgi:hypothetical protein